MAPSANIVSQVQYFIELGLAKKVGWEKSSGQSFHMNNLTWLLLLLKKFQNSLFFSLLFSAKLFSFSCKHFVLLGFTDSTKLSTVNIPEVY